MLEQNRFHVTVTGQKGADISTFALSYKILSDSSVYTNNKLACLPLYSYVLLHMVSRILKLRGILKIILYKCLTLKMKKETERVSDLQGQTT